MLSNEVHEAQSHEPLPKNLKVEKQSAIVRRQGQELPIVSAALPFKKRGSKEVELEGEATRPAEFVFFFSPMNLLFLFKTGK